MGTIPRSYGGHLVQRGYRDVPLSFETAEQGTTRLYFQERVRVTRIRGIVTRALAATDAGTITPKDSAGATISGGTLTFTAGAALGTAQSGAPTSNNVVAPGSYIDLVSAKTTAGGKVTVSVEWEPAP